MIMRENPTEKKKVCKWEWEKRRLKSKLCFRLLLERRTAYRVYFILWQVQLVVGVWAIICTNLISVLCPWNKISVLIILSHALWRKTEQHKHTHTDETKRNNVFVVVSAHMYIFYILALALSHNRYCVYAIFEAIPLAVQFLS